MSEANKALNAASMTVDEFLAWAEGQEGRHELFRGQVYAMAPERSAHALTKLAIHTALLEGIRRAGFALRRLSGWHDREWPVRWTVERAPPPPDFRRGSYPGYAPDRLQPRAPAGPSFPRPIQKALDALIAREFAPPNLLQRHMHSRRLLGRQLPYFSDSFFKALVHCRMLSFWGANFHPA
jgi:hypothetical protein